MTARFKSVPAINQSVLVTEVGEYLESTNNGTAIINTSTFHLSTNFALTMGHYSNPKSDQSKHDVQVSGLRMEHAFTNVTAKKPFLKPQVITFQFGAGESLS